jgi:hypothetical protein
MQIPRRRTRAKKRPTRTARRRTATRTRRKRPASKEAHLNALLVFMMFLYMLRLIDEKTLRRIKRDLSPKKKRTTARRRHRK